MSKKEFLVTHFMETDDGKIENGNPGLMHSEGDKDILVIALNATYEVAKEYILQYHIYVNEVIDGVVRKCIQHVGWSRGSKRE